MGLIEIVEQSPMVYIFGAQIYSVSVYFALKSCCKGLKVLNFLVTDKGNNPETVDCISVIEVQEVKLQFRNTTVLIATPELYHGEIEECLRKKGIDRIVAVNSILLNELLRVYYISSYKSKGRIFKLVEDISEISDGRNNSQVELDAKQVLRVYMAKSHRDKIITNQPVLQEWIEVIQVGASLAENYICKLRDNKGVRHISARNYNYCELTAAYWILQYGLSYDYVGLCHYRRYLDVPAESVVALTTNRVDAILPYPMMVYPNVLSHHKRYVKEQDWERMMTVLEKLYPEYYKASKNIFNNREMYLHNVWVLSSGCAKEFLEWLFSILLEIEATYEKDKVICRDRYMGYIGESLTSLYFIYNRDKLKVLHAGEVILV